MSKDFEKRIEKKVDSLTTTVDNLAARLDNLTTTVDNLTTTVDNFATTVDNLATTVDSLTTTVDNLAAATARGFAETASKIELGKIKHSLDRIENIPLRDHNNRIERIEDKLMQTEVFLGKRFK